MNTSLKKSKPQKYLIFGGTGSLGTTLTRRLVLQGHTVAIFSRDEAKNFYHKQLFAKFQRHIRYFIGDIRNYNTVLNAIFRFQPNAIIAAAAMKQVPLCEEFPEEAIQTNIIGAQNVAQAAVEFARTASSLGVDLPIPVLSISTDKAVKPVNAYGCTKALQEKIHLRYNGNGILANCVRYGNVLESTGSVLPVFKAQLEAEENLTVTDIAMTRFLLSLNEAVDLIFKGLADTEGGKVFVPKLRSAYIIEVAKEMCRAAGRDPLNSIVLTGIRPGEKLHEVLISEEECHRVQFNVIHGMFVIHPQAQNAQTWTENNFSSNDLANLIKNRDLETFLQEKGVIPCMSVSQALRVSLAKT
jgi:FlaA1/EpsC-like NDP-sugar epimerase